ncbi:hypothetical protein [Sulfurimonas sp.]|uniref:hypothetical protein n=1 Tax=Sulfurimonas sp. TaxID=2022749 RepID=UPI003D09A9C8
MEKITKIFVALAFTASASLADDMLIVDTSGSLANKQKEVRAVVNQYLKKSIKVLAFNSSPYFVKHERELNFNGDTALSLALNKVQTENINFLTIVTDGLPNDEEESIKVANRLKQQGVKICAVFISDNSEIPKTFNLIADRSFIISDVNKALDTCSDSVKQELGYQAIQKTVELDKYTF